MNSFEVTIVKPSEANIIKQMINQMYGFEYEVRSVSVMEQVIEQKKQVFVIAKQGENIVGFAGATTNSDEYKQITTKTQTVIEYIYTIPTHRNFYIAFELAKKLLQTLAEWQKTCAIMQVQTFNKQRFFHYALSDKNIIAETTCTTSAGKQYFDQVLLVEDITKVLAQTCKQFIQKVGLYKKSC